MRSRRGLLITGTDTGVGKTTVGCGLVAGLRTLGARVGVMKPAETGCELRDGGLIALDAIALRAAAGSLEPIDAICPYRYQTPLAPAAAAQLEGRPAPDIERIRTIHDRLARAPDVMLVEGAGGITVSLTWQTNYADLARALDLDLILVIGNKLGCLNAAVLTLDYATRRGLRIRGYFLNDAFDERSPAAHTNADSLSHLTDARCLGTIAHGGTVTAEMCRRLLDPADN